MLLNLPLSVDAIEAPFLNYFDRDFSTQPNVATATGPAACYDSASNKTYWAWLAEGSPQVCRIAAYDHSTGIWSEPVTIDRGPNVDDTHGNPSVCVDHQGYIYVFWSARFANGIRWLISDNAGDITSWVSQTTLTNAANYTYPKPVVFGTDIYLFARVGVTSDSKLVVRKASPSGGAASFGSEVNLVDFTAADVGIYAAEVRKNGSEIEFMACQQTGASPQVRKHLFYFAWNPSTGAMRNIDSTTTVASGSLPILHALALSDFREFDSGSNVTEIPSWCRDGSGDLHAVFFDDNSNPYDLKHMIWDGSSWSTPTVVVSMNGRGVPRIRYLCLVPAGADVQLWYPFGDAGGWTQVGGDDMVRKIWSGGSWGSQTTIVTGDGVNAMAHPNAVENADPEIRVVFGESAQSELYNDRFLNKRYSYGDPGFAEWGEPDDPYEGRVIERVIYQGADNSTPANIDTSWVHTPILWSGNAKITSNRLALDGTGDYTSLESLLTSSNRRYYMDGGANKNDGEFCIDLRRIKFNNTTQTAAIWGRSGGSGSRSIIIIYRGELTPDQFSFEYSFNGSTLLTLRFNFTPDTTKEYDFRITRDPSGILRLHYGESGSDLVMQNSASIGTSQLSPQTNRVNHGSFNNGTNTMNGSIGATRVTLDHRGTSDANVPASEMAFDA
jgi:BNR repeat-containing family member